MNIRLSLRTTVIAAVTLLSLFVAAQTPPPTTAPATAAPVNPPPPPAKTYSDGVVKVGDSMKQTKGRITDIEKGDNGCYITLRDDKKNEFIEVGTFALCTQKPPIKGKRVEMTYNMETIQAADCYGDPKCKRTETVPVITAVQITE